MQDQLFDRDSTHVNFIAIDFETANYSRGSACSIGIVEVEEGEIRREHSRLIQPPSLEFEPRFTDLHGIDADMVADQPDFGQVCRELDLCGMLAGRLVAAHNAGFDMSVLAAACRHYRIRLPAFFYLCTVELSRRFWPWLANHQLPAVAGSLGIGLCHHRAIDDARACVGIVLAAAAADPDGFVAIVDQSARRFGRAAGR